MMRILINIAITNWFCGSQSRTRCVKLIANSSANTSINQSYTVTTATADTATR